MEMFGVVEVVFSLNTPLVLAWLHGVDLIFPFNNNCTHRDVNQLENVLGSFFLEFLVLYS